MFGFLNIYKPQGFTSFDVVAVLRKVTHIKQIGHTGTLDPFAEGVLPICIGKSTKLIEYLPDDKEYIATVQFGANTDTYDIEGKVIKTFNKKILKEAVLGVLKDFEGETEQIPPIYSAIKVNGKRLYNYAREGKEVEIKPRKIFISKIELLSFDEEKQTAKICVACSKGTYIRSIAYDIGQKLNCGGYLKELVRTNAGMFEIENSIRLKDIKTFDDVHKYLINPLDVLPIQQYQLNEQERELVLHGMSIKYCGEFAKIDNIYLPQIVFLVYDGKINAVGMVKEDRIVVRKVFEVL